PPAVPRLRQRTQRRPPCPSPIRSRGPPAGGAERRHRDDTPAGQHGGRARPTSASGGRTTMADVTVYGAPWCPDCRRSKKFLAEQRIAFDWVDIDQSPDGAALVQERNNGAQIIPTIVFADGSHL